MSWRDDLPEIPEERIRTEAIHEGARRREARLRRQRTVLYGGMGAAAVALVIFAGAQLETGDDDDDDSAGVTEAPADTAAAATTGAPGTTASGTEAPATTAATGTTTGGTTGGTTSETAGAPGTTTAASDTTFPDYTTVGGPIAALPPSRAVIVATSTNLWEQPASGRDCGPTRLTVVFDPGSTPQSPVVHWETAGARDEAPMEIAAGTGVREIGPFPAETLEDGAVHEVLVYVTDTEASGDQIFRGPTVILRDCSP